MKRLLIIVGMLLLMQGCLVVSDGERVGALVQFSRTGIIFKTYEGTMVLGGLTTTGVSETYRFSTEDQFVAKELESKIGQMVKIKYQKELIVMPWRGSTNYLVKSVELYKPQ